MPPASTRSSRPPAAPSSSRAGLSTSLTGIQAYASAKHGQVGLVEELAQELGPFGITVNSVAPGFMAANPGYERQWNSYSEEFPRSFPERIAMRRMGRPEDIVDAVIFPASDLASWITGQNPAGDRLTARLTTEEVIMPDSHVPQLEPWQWPMPIGVSWSSRSAPAAATGPGPGRAARAALAHYRSIRTKRPTSCAMATSRSAAWPEASRATGSAYRASASCSKGTT